MRKSSFIPVRLECGHDRLVTTATYFAGFTVCVLCRKKAHQPWWRLSRRITRMLKLRCVSARPYAVCQ